MLSNAGDRAQGVAVTASNAGGQLHSVNQVSTGWVRVENRDALDARNDAGRKRKEGRVHERWKAGFMQVKRKDGMYSRRKGLNEFM
jgi:hypothetical protein